VTALFTLPARAGPTGWGCPLPRDVNRTERGNIQIDPYPEVLIKPRFRTLKAGSFIIGTTSETILYPSPDLYDYAQTQGRDNDY